MGRLVGVREEFQIGLGAAPIRTGGNRFVFRDAMTGVTASGLMSVLEWNVALDKWVQVEPPQGDRPSSEFSEWVNKQLEVVWSQPIGRLRPPARPREAELKTGVSVLPYVAPGTLPSIAPAPTPAPAPLLLPAPTPAPAPTTSAPKPLEVVTAHSPAVFPAANGVVPIGPVDEGGIIPAGYGLPDLPVWAWIAIAGGAVYLFTRK